jgi:hypothetical protein
MAELSTPDDSPHTPPEYAKTPPPPPAGGTQDFAPHTFQAVMEMQKSIGGLECAVANLVRKADDHGKTISRIEKIMYAATAAISAVGIVISAVVVVLLWLVDTFKDTVIEAIKNIPQ